MTMFARDLSVAHYRSFDSYHLALDEGVTILAGPNAAGKTNLIEALQLLTSGASFRHPTAAELVHDGVGSCKVELRLEGDVLIHIDYSHIFQFFINNSKRRI